MAAGFGAVRVYMCRRSPPDSLLAMVRESGRIAGRCGTFPMFEREGGATEATQHGYPAQGPSGSEAGNPFFSED